MLNIGDIVYKKSDNEAVILGMIVDESGNYIYLHFFPNYPEQKVGYHLIGMSIFGRAEDDTIVIPAPKRKQQLFNNLTVSLDDSVVFGENIDDFISKKE